MSIPYAAAVIFNQDAENLLYVMKFLKMKQKGSAQSESDLPSHLPRAAGILKYMRESTDHRLTIVPQSQVLMDYQIKCEYCGQQASPSLDLICMHELHSETALTFCCDQWEQLYQLLLKLSYLEGQSEDLKMATEEDTCKQSQDLVYRRSMEKVSKFTDSPKENKPEENFFKDYLIEVPVQETAAPGSKAMSFHLSCPPEGSWAKLPENLTEKMANFDDKALKTDMEVPFSVPFCDHVPLDFGICHHQDGGDFVNKYYLEGTRFLTMFDNGSAQVFYPSGLLAIIVAVTKEHGRVCIVYDTPCQAIRALFQSDGKGSCYHSNGNIWLTINKSGGQCLDPEGARARRWTWYSLGFTPTPLRPIFMSINKSIGLRVLGKEQVFVSFLAKGQQAKFNVGAWCHKGNCKETKEVISASRPILLKDELIALAARLKMHLLIQHVHQYMMTPSHPKLPNATLAPRLHLLAQNLLKVGKKVKMSEDDVEFLHGCLRDCL